MKLWFAFWPSRSARPIVPALPPLAQWTCPTPLRDEVAGLVEAAHELRLRTALPGERQVAVHAGGAGGTL